MDTNILYEKCLCANIRILVGLFHLCCVVFANNNKKRTTKKMAKEKTSAAEYEQNTEDGIHSVHMPKSKYILQMFVSNTTEKKKTNIK